MIIGNILCIAAGAGIGALKSAAITCAANEIKTFVAEQFSKDAMENIDSPGIRNTTSYRMSLDDNLNDVSNGDPSTIDWKHPQKTLNRNATYASTKITYLLVMNRWLESHKSEMSDKEYRTRKKALNDAYKVIMPQYQQQINAACMM